MRGGGGGGEDALHGADLVGELAGPRDHGIGQRGRRLAKVERLGDLFDVVRRNETERPRFSGLRSSAHRSRQYMTGSTLFGTLGHAERSARA